jgi:MFS transporter, DHA3 family, macrolide efflux protein
MRPRRYRGMDAFWLMWGGLIASFTGSGLTRFGLSVWVYQETRDAQAFALLLFFGVLPLSIGALIAGPLVDRLDRRRVLVVSNAVTRLPTLFVMVLWWQGGLELWHIYLALAVNGLANAFVLPAFDASVRMLVPRERLGQASGYSQLMQSLGVVVGPPIAGLFLVAFGLGSIFVIDLVTVVLALGALAFVRIPNPVRSRAAAANSVWGDFVFGLRYVVERPTFLFLSLFLAIVVFGWGFVYALSGPIVLGLGDESTIGLVYAAFGIGSVVGAMAFAAWGGPRRRIPAILAVTLVNGVLTVLAGLRPNVLWIGAFIALLGSA